MNTYKQRAPRSLEEAKERKRNLISEIQTIETQLGSKTRKDHLHSDPNEYYQWRTNAQRALNARLAELRFLKGWIKDVVRARSHSIVYAIKMEADGRDIIGLTISADGHVKARFAGENCDVWEEFAELGSFNLLDLLEP